MSSGVINGLSDVFAQDFLGTGFLDWWCEAAFTFIAAALTAPIFNVLYEVLERFIPATDGLHKVALQLAIDQLFGNPVWLFFFFPTMEGLHKGLLKHIAPSFRRDTSVSHYHILIPD